MATMSFPNFTSIECTKKAHDNAPSLSNHTTLSSLPDMLEDGLHVEWHSDDFSDSASSAGHESEEQLGANDDELSAKKEQKDEAEVTKADEERFLAKLVAMCDTKTNGYEDAAIAEAISILNSDAEFEAFSKSAYDSESIMMKVRLLAIATTPTARQKLRVAKSIKEAYLKRTKATAHDHPGVMSTTAPTARQSLRMAKGIKESYLRSTVVNAHDCFDVESRSTGR